MSRLYVFADEAGCFEFSRKRNVSKYFILCTISMEDCQLGADLLNLRRKLAWEGEELGEYFHATSDKQSVRDAVYAELAKHKFTVHATIMEKSKAQPQVRKSKERFYQYGWYYHFKNVAPKILNDKTELMTTAASIGTRKEKDSFKGAIDDVMKQVVKTADWKTDFCPAAADPCVQAADYCAWAIQRKWEMNDERSYNLISDRVIHEYNMWERGTTHHY